MSDETPKNPTSDRKIQSNRRNARKSTGPRSEKGKSVSRENALTHGFYARIVVPESEKSPEIESMRVDWIESFRPVNKAAFLVVDNAFRSQRVYTRALEAAEARLAARADEARRDFQVERFNFNRTWIAALRTDPEQALPFLSCREDGNRELLVLLDSLEAAAAKKSWSDADADLLFALQGKTRKTVAPELKDQAFELVDLLAEERGLDADPFHVLANADEYRRVQKADEEAGEPLDDAAQTLRRERRKSLEEAETFARPIREARRADNARSLPIAAACVGAMLNMIRSELEECAGFNDGEYARALTLRVEQAKFDDSEAGRRLERYLSSAQKNAERDLKLALLVTGARLFDPVDKNEAKASLGENADDAESAGAADPPPDASVA